MVADYQGSRDQGGIVKGPNAGANKVLRDSQMVD